MFLLYVAASGMVSPYSAQPLTYNVTFLTQIIHYVCQLYCRHVSIVIKVPGMNSTTFQPNAFDCLRHSASIEGRRGYGGGVTHC